MRILILSSYYPPFFIGGYELRAEQMARALSSKGHEVHVLTSRHGSGKKTCQEETVVHRMLDARPDIRIGAGSQMRVIRMITREWHNHKQLKRILRQVSPDVVLVMHHHSLLKSIVFQLVKVCRIVVFDISDPAFLHLYRKKDNWNKWFDWWDAVPNRPLTMQAKKIIKRMVSNWIPVEHCYVSLEKSYFTSLAMKKMYQENGLDVSSSHVMAPGIKLSDYPFFVKTPVPRKTRLLYAGRIAPEKGVETAIQALDILKKEVDMHVSLTIAGPCHQPLYREKLEKMVHSFYLNNRIALLGPRDMEEMPDLYRQHDVFVFPAVWEEPFGRAWIEALASGLPLITTATGGSREYLVHERNCLIFPKKDADGLAGAIARLVREPEMAKLITENGRAMVERNFCFHRFIEEVDCFLKKHAKALLKCPA